MKILLDNNISFKLAGRLKDIGSDCIHIKDTSLPVPASDIEIWNWARLNNCAILTFDDDFSHFETLYGFPPKIILLKFGNTPTGKLEQIIRRNWPAIEIFFMDGTSGILEIY